MNIELKEEKEEGENVSNVYLRNRNRKLITSGSEQVSSLRHHCHELNQLKKGQIGFPPDWKRLSGLGILGVHADKVVGVHYCVNESIQCNSEEDIGIIKNVCVQPVEHENGKVMVDMEERKLSPFFPQYNKNSIPKVPHLGNVEKPQKSCQRRVLLTVRVARDNAVPTSVCKQNGLYCHVSTKHNLGNIVEEFDCVRIDRIPLFHHPGTDYNKQEVRKGNADCRSKVGQRPSLQ